MPIPVPSGGTLYFKFTTRGTTGLPTTLSGSPVVSIYKDASTTESTAGVTLTADFDSRTGYNHVSIDTSADGTFYANGHTFYLTITTGTVGGTSVVGEVVGEFELGFPLVQLADGVAHGGTPGSSTATFAMQSMQIVNPIDNAVIFQGNGTAFQCVGLSGHGIFARGTESAITGITTAGDTFALHLAGNGAGGAANFDGSGSGSGAVGILITGNDTGPAVRMSTDNADAVRIVPGGTNVHGLNIAGGSVSGDAVHKTATDGHGDFAQGGNGKAAVVPGTLAVGS